MIGPCSVVKIGATRKGKTLSAVRDMVEATDEACVLIDPHKDSLAASALAHADGNVLHQALSDVRRPLGFELLSPSRAVDSMQRQLENQLRAEAFVDVFLRRRNVQGLAATPLLEEWCMAAISLFLSQASPKPLSMLPAAFLPGTTDFASLVDDCILPDIRAKFRQLERLNPRALRAEVGSASRLFSAVFRSPAFSVRCNGGFDLGAFLQRRGTLVLERGDDVGDDTLRVVMGTVVLRTIEHAKRRSRPHPPIRVYIDEATNAGLYGRPEERALAETSKNGLYFTLLVQNLDFPGGVDAVLTNCLRHEWFGCPYYEVARKGAIDVAAGLPTGEESRAERIAQLTDDIMNLPPGWRWVRDPSGSRKEYVPRLDNPWPDWPGLREAKLKEKLQWIYDRPAYGASAETPSPSSLSDTPRRPRKLQRGSSPAERWRRETQKRDAGSENNGDEEKSA